MKYIIVLLLIITGCAKNDESGPGPQGPPGESCSVTDAENGTLITCGSTSTLILDPEVPSAPSEPEPVVSVIDVCKEKDKLFITMSDGRVVVLNKRLLNRKFRKHRHNEKCEED